MLRELREYALRLEAVGELPPRMYQPTRIKWLVELGRDGSFRGFVNTVPENARGPEKRGKEYLAPHLVRTAGAIRPKLLADRADYALGVCPSDVGKRERVVQAHDAFCDLTCQCAESLHDPGVQAVATFLGAGEVSRLPLPEDFNAGDIVSFLVDGELLIGSPAVRGWWAARNEPDPDPEKARYCLGCGEQRTLAARHPVSIKGIPGGQSSGMQLISANENAFESYGLRASLVAPVCHTCAEQYAQALNALLRDEDTHLNVGGAALVFWTRQETGFSPTALLSRPGPEDVARLVQSALGKSPSRVDEGDFYACAFSASGGRVVVRDWTTTTIGSVQESLARFFVSQALVDPSSEPGRPLGVFALAASIVREAKDIEPQTVKALVHQALFGGRLPNNLLQRALARSRTGGSAGPGSSGSNVMPRSRAVLIKMVLASGLPEEEARRMESLDTSNREPAYLCGRLFAELERAQRLAVGAKATINDRFYGSASTTPVTVFPTLMRGSQNHLAKLRKTRRGAYAGIQAAIEEIVAGLPSFPRVLTLREQGMFALGYYHQRAENRRRASEHATTPNGSDAAADLDD